MARKVNGTGEDLLPLVLIAGVAFVGYKLLGPLMHLLPDSADQDEVDTVNTADPDTNPFSINYQYSLYSQDPDRFSGQWWLNLKQQFDNVGYQQAIAISGVYNYAYWGDLLINSFGLVTEVDNNVDTVFGQIRSKADVANLATYMYFVYQTDLFSLIKNGTGVIPFLSRGLSTGHLAQIIQHVNSLPNSN